MAEELQELLERIRREGVEQATRERERILQEAHREAERLVHEAERHAAELRQRAETDAKLTEQRAQAAIRQAARDIILALREELLRRLTGVVRSCVGEALSPEAMGQLIVAMQRAYLERKSDGESALEVLVGPRDLERLETHCRTALLQDLKVRPQLILAPEIGAGLKLGTGSGDLFLDVTDETVAELICAYVGPRLAALLRDEKEVNRPAANR